MKLNPDELGTVAGGIGVGEILAADMAAGELPAHVQNVPSAEKFSLIFKTIYLKSS